MMKKSFVIECGSECRLIVSQIDNADRPIVLEFHDKIDGAYRVTFVEMSSQTAADLRAALSELEP